MPESMDDNPRISRFHNYPGKAARSRHQFNGIRCLLSLTQFLVHQSPIGAEPRDVPIMLYCKDLRGFYISLWYVSWYYRVWKVHRRHEGSRNVRRLSEMHGVTGWLISEKCRALQEKSIWIVGAPIEKFFDCLIVLLFRSIGDLETAPGEYRCDEEKIWRTFIILYPHIHQVCKYLNISISFSSLFLIVALKRSNIVLHINMASE